MPKSGRPEQRVHASFMTKILRDTVVDDSNDDACKGEDLASF